MSLAEAESLAAQYGIGFEPNPGEPLPTREALQAGLEFIRNISVSSETVPMDTGDIASDSENRTCEHGHGVFASMFQYPTLTLGTIQESDAYVDLTRHDHEFREWNVPDNWVLDMWVSHVDKDDYPVGHTGWEAKISCRLYIGSSATPRTRITPSTAPCIRSRVPLYGNGAPVKGCSAVRKEASCSI